jgi:hypothetical protein
MSAPTQVSDSIHELAAEAQTTPQLMRALWQLAADASKNMQKGVSYLSIIIYLVCLFVYTTLSHQYQFHYVTIKSCHVNNHYSFNRTGLSHRPLSRHGTKTIQPKIPQQTNGPL